MAEAQFVDACKERDEAAVFFRIEQGYAADLGHGFGDEDAGHDRFSREMALEKLFIEGRILDADGIFHRFKFDDAVYEQHGIAMRQNFHNISYFQSHENSSLNHCISSNILWVSRLFSLWLDLTAMMCPRTGRPSRDRSPMISRTL